MQIINNQSPRWTSIDALRGFNMLWIIGAEHIAGSLLRLQSNRAAFLAAQFSHADWQGFTFYDLIFPLFIFVTGISTVFSIQRQREHGLGTLSIMRHIFIRAAVLFALGVYMSNAGFSMHGWLHHELRWVGVLQRIAVCYYGASLLLLITKPRHQIIITAGLLIGYWMLLRFIPVPGYGTAVWDPPVANLANFFDSLFLPGRLYYDTWDPEGILSSLPALATCMLGVLTAEFLKWQGVFRGRVVDEKKKIIYLTLAGLITAGLGIWWSLDFPFIKKIWTSSYVLLTGGISMILSALFHWLFDVIGLRKLAFPLVVVGRNSVFIYLASSIIPFGAMAVWLTGGQAFAWLGNWQPFFRAILTLLFEWLLLYILYCRKIFIKL